MLVGSQIDRVARRRENDVRKTEKPFSKRRDDETPWPPVDEMTLLSSYARETTFTVTRRVPSTPRCATDASCQHADAYVCLRLRTADGSGRSPRLPFAGDRRNRLGDSAVSFAAQETRRENQVCTTQIELLCSVPASTPERTGLIILLLSFARGFAAENA